MINNDSEDLSGYSEFKSLLDKEFSNMAAETNNTPQDNNINKPFSLFDDMDDEEEDDFENQLCIQPANPGKDNKFEWKVDKLRRSIKALREDIPVLRSEKFAAYKDEIELCRYIIQNVFPANMDYIPFYARNLSFNNDNGRTLNRIGIRLNRNPEEYYDEDEFYEQNPEFEVDYSEDNYDDENYDGENYDDEEPDWLLTELGLDHRYNLLFTGVLSRDHDLLTVEDISLIADPEEILECEYDTEAVIKNTPKEVESCDFEEVLLLPSLYKQTENRLSEWTGYLNWQEKLTNLRIKGCKYIGIQYLENDKKRKEQLLFVLIARSNEEFDDTIKYLRRGNVSIYNNNISKNDNTFDYVYSNRGERVKRNRIVAEDIGSCMGIYDRFPLSEAGDRLKGIVNFSAKQNKNKTESNETEDEVYSLEKLIEYYGDNPVILRLAYRINQDDESRLKEDDNIETNEDIAAFINGKVIPQYPKNGFVACREVGTFALIRRETDAVNRLKNGESFSPHINEWLFDVTKARKSVEIPEITHWKNEAVGKNPSQKRAIEKMVAAQDLFLLQGPPGTGKTTVIAEAIYQFAIRGKRVLLASQSNDAVDNALEDLAATPEIRAIRVDPRKIKNISDKNEEEAAERLSEDTALSFYFKSISHKIDAEQYEWKSTDEESDILAKEQQTLKFYNIDIAELNNNYLTQQQNLDNIQKNLAECSKELFEANKRNEDLIPESTNYKLFINFIKGDEKGFYLSKRQLDLINGEILVLLKAASDKGIVLSKSYSETANEHDKNISLQILLKNYRTLRSLHESLKTAKKADSNAINPELEKIQQEINAITEKLGTCTEAESEQLMKELSEKKSKKLKLSQNTSNGFELTSAQKEILSEQLILQIRNDPAAVSKSIAEAGNAVVTSINKLTNILNEAVTNSAHTNTTELQNKHKILEGQQASAQEELNRIAGKINEKKSIISKLVQKYNITGQNDYEIAQNLTTAIERKINEVLDKQQTFLKKQKDWGVSLAKYSKILGEHSNQKEFIELENAHYKQVFFKTCNVVGITCTSDPSALKEKGFIDDFDVVIIDEVSKATPTELLLSLLKGRKTILVGDHRQLPPAFGENEASYLEQVEEVQNNDEYSAGEKREITLENFKKYEHMVTSSIFKEHFEKADESLKETLRTQYRMHPHIMNIINEFYEDQKLECGIENVEVQRNHELTIPAVDGTPFIVPERHAYWIDSSKLPNGKPFYESKEGTGTSTCNYLEEELTFELLKKIARQYRELGYPKKIVDPQTHKEYEKKVSVGVISFYMLSKKHLQNGIKELRNNKDTKDDFKALQISVNTVDRFQGQQKDVIISTLVRNWNPKQKRRITSFIAAYERINVAFSRARKLLFIVGANDLFDKVPVTLSLFDKTTGKNRERTVNVYRDIVTKLKFNSGTSKGFFGSEAILRKEAAAKLNNKHAENENDRKAQRRS